MKWSRVTKAEKVGTELREEKIKGAYIEVKDSSAILVVHDVLGRTIRTSRIEDAKQTAPDAFLFITKSGSRYAITFCEEEFNLDNIFFASLKIAMDDCINCHPLRYTLNGSRIMNMK